jgi:DNA ligase-1
LFFDFFFLFVSSSDPEDIASFLQLAIQSSCEGLMVKALEVDATYIPNKRNWLKVKKDYLDGCGDSLDLIPIGASFGKGKRTGIFGTFLLATYDEETEEYQTICNLGTGFSDEDLIQHAEFFNQHLLDSKPKYYNVPEG